jgi:hypothetical protein
VPSDHIEQVVQLMTETDEIQKLSNFIKKMGPWKKSITNISYAKGGVNS